MIYNAWELTWDELCQLAEKRQPIVTLEGYLLSSPDRKFHPREAQGSYFTSVARACVRGMSVPDAVRKEYAQRMIGNGLSIEEAHKCAYGAAPVDSRPQNAKGKPFSWSFTALTNFEGCPARYAAERFYCTTAFVETEAIRWGNRVHKAAEILVRDGKLTDPEAFKEVEKYARLFCKLKESGADVQAEQEITLTENLKPTGWFDKDAWLRIKLDVTVQQESKCGIYDYKTGGKIKDDQDQLKLCCATHHVLHPEVEAYTPKLIWTKHQTITGTAPEVIPASQIPSIWENVLPRVERMVQAWKSENFPARPSGLCPWCSIYATCPSARRK